MIVDGYDIQIIGVAAAGIREALRLEPTTFAPAQLPPVASGLVATIGFAALSLAMVMTTRHRRIGRALTQPIYCTMKGYRALELGGSASLSAVCRHIKLARAGDLHGAIEDAWLAMQIYLWLHGRPLQGRLRGSLPRTPSNFRHAEIGPYRVDR